MISATGIGSQSCSPLGRDWYRGFYGLLRVDEVGVVDGGGVAPPPQRDPGCLGRLGWPGPAPGEYDLLDTEIV